MDSRSFGFQAVTAERSPSLLSLASLTELLVPEYNSAIYLPYRLSFPPFVFSVKLLPVGIGDENQGRREREKRKRFKAK